MSSADVSTPELLLESLLIMIKDIEDEYGILPKNIKSPHTSFKELIKTLLGENGVVVLIDEYDSPLLKKLKIFLVVFIVS